MLRKEEDIEAYDQANFLFKLDTTEFAMKNLTKRGREEYNDLWINAKEIMPFDETPSYAAATVNETHPGYYLIQSAIKDVALVVSFGAAVCYIYEKVNKPM